MNSGYRTPAFLLIAAIVGLFVSVSAIAQVDGDPVLTFVNSLQSDDRASAAALVDGPVSQSSGFGPFVVGGPHAGPWNNKIIEGKDTLTATEAFQSFANFNFDLAGKASPSPTEKSGWVRYSCPLAVRIVFYVKPSASKGKVMMYDLGRSLITIQRPDGRD